MKLQLQLIEETRKQGKQKTTPSQICSFSSFQTFPECQLGPRAKGEKPELLEFTIPELQLTGQVEQFPHTNSWSFPKNIWYRKILKTQNILVLKPDPHFMNHPIEPLLLNILKTSKGMSQSSRNLGKQSFFFCILYENPIHLQRSSCLKQNFPVTVIFSARGDSSCGSCSHCDPRRSGESIGPTGPTPNSDGAGIGAQRHRGGVARRSSRSGAHQRWQIDYQNGAVNSYSCICIPIIHIHV